MNPQTTSRDGGPASLNLGTLIKRRQPATEVTIFAQNLADATFGFGVAFSDCALDFLRADDPASFAAFKPHSELGGYDYPPWRTGNPYRWYRFCGDRIHPVRDAKVISRRIRDRGRHKGAQLRRRFGPTFDVDQWIAEVGL